MRLNKLFCCILTVFCVFFTMCERSDLLSGAGGSVVGGTDTTLTDMERGFVMLSLGAGAVTRSFSLPDSAAPGFSTQVQTYMLAGINRDGDTLAAHMEFQAVPKSGLSYTAEDGNDLEARIYFHAADTSSSSTPITLFPSDTLPMPVRDSVLVPAHVNRGDSTITDTECRELGLPCETDVDGNYISPAGTGIGQFTLRPDSAGSITLPNSVAKKIFYALTSADPTTVHPFAFSIVNYEKRPLLKIHNPYVVLRVNRIYRGDTLTSHDTLYSLTRFTAFESNAGMKAELPYSSQQTMRTAAFEIDITRLDSLYRRGYELINAVLALSVNRSNEDCEATGGETLASCGIKNYRIIVSDTLFSVPPSGSGITPDSLGTILRARFNRTGSTSPSEPFNTHNIRGVLKNTMSNKNRYIYVYLRALDDAMMRWEIPDKLETVFTPYVKESIINTYEE